MMPLRPLLIALFAAALAVPALAQTQTEPEARVIVRFKPQADSVRAKALTLRATRFEAREIAQTRATALGMRTGQALRAGLSLDERTHVVTARGMTSTQLAKRLAADTEVDLVAVDERRKRLALPDDPLFGGAESAPSNFIGRFPDSDGKLQDTYSRTVDQWYLKAPSSTPGQVVSSVNAPAAWELAKNGSGTVVAVLDTGVRLDHPDLADQVVGGYDMIGLGSPGKLSTAIANDGDGPDADPSDPGDWVSSADIGSLGDGCDASDISNSSWHGTRVSGLIAAKTDNGLGMAGIGREILKILPVRVLGKCGGYDSDIMAGMKWAAGLSVPGLPANTNKAKVLNLSLGGSGSCDPDATTSTASQRETARLYRETIIRVNATGSTIVIAAGNSAGHAVGLPGNCPGVVTVAALRHVGTKVGFSSVGGEVTIAAPGGNCVNLAVGYPCLYPMVSTTNSGTTSPATYTGDGIYTGSNASVGTSFSAPVVSGIVGLMASVRPALTSAEVTPILKLTARAFPITGGSVGTAACVAPTTTDQLECYCTKDTCGAGMVDAFAAVKAAQALNGATVTVTPSAGLTAAQSGTLTAAITGLASGKTVTATKWTINDKGGNVVGDFSSGANSATATLTPAAAGNFVVQADVTDSDGYVHSQVATVSVAAAPVVTPPATSGGGGGAVSAAWLLALLLAAFSLKPSLKRPTPQPLRCRP
ncbi:S8 family peptidase [Roseateles sp.]|uniref:S8 family peptidase n=1 Tax=Roseateles sp. TaxID=1971397 RepID=UPI0032631048